MTDPTQCRAEYPRLARVMPNGRIIRNLAPDSPSRPTPGVRTLAAQAVAAHMIGADLGITVQPGNPWAQPNGRSQALADAVLATIEPELERRRAEHRQQVLNEAANACSMREDEAAETYNRDHRLGLGSAREAAVRQRTWKAAKTLIRDLIATATAVLSSATQMAEQAPAVPQEASEAQGPPGGAPADLDEEIEFWAAHTPAPPDDLRTLALAAIRDGDHALADAGECGRPEDQAAVVDAVLAAVLPEHRRQVLDEALNRVAGTGPAARQEPPRAAQNPQATPDTQPATQDRYRVGRKLGRTIYRQTGEHPDRDELIGLMDTPELGAMVVAALNGRRCDALCRDVDDERDRLAARVTELKAALDRSQATSDTLIRQRDQERAQRDAAVRAYETCEHIPDAEHAEVVADRDRLAGMVRALWGVYETWWHQTGTYDAGQRLVSDGVEITGVVLLGIDDDQAMEDACLVVEPHEMAIRQVLGLGDAGHRYSIGQRVTVKVRDACHGGTVTERAPSVKDGAPVYFVRLDKPAPTPTGPIAHKWCREDDVILGDTGQPDEDITEEEFDRRWAAGTPVEVVGVAQTYATSPPIHLAPPGDAHCCACVMGYSCALHDAVCCDRCTEATHDTLPIRHADGTVCSAPDLSGTDQTPEGM